MINKININTSSNKNNNTPSFKAGPLDGATWLLEQCNVYPMAGVSLIDGITAIAPRTYIDAKTNGFAAAETFRRESSGLVVNCLIPGFVVWGVAKVMDMFKSGKDSLKLSNLWANEDSMKELHNRFSTAKNTDKYIDGIFEDLHVNVGKEWKKAGDESEFIPKAKTLLKNILNETQGKTPKDLKEVEQLIHDGLKGAEHIKLGKDAKPFGTNLHIFLRDTVDCGKIFKKLSPEQFKGFLEKAVKASNTKSLLGLAIIIPLAASMQSINRWITRKSSGKEGAPIYKDFIDEHPDKKSNKEEKPSFWGKKIAAAGLMTGVAILSMMKKPSWKMLQFNGKMPSMDQCRWIATATFASRMLAAEDENELREATFRDIATFSSLYFFGDYVNKGVGSLIKKATKGKIDLMNYMSELPEKAGKWKKFKHWITETKLKSFAESGEISTKAKNMRALCEISSLGFSMLLLGILVPWYVRRKTEMKRKEEVESTYNKYHTYPSIFPTGHEKKAFQAFGMLEADKQQPSQV